MAFPRMPSQVFITEKSGELKHKPNPYFPDMDYTYKGLILLYLGLCRLAGHRQATEEPRIIKTITLTPELKKIDIVYASDLNENTEQALFTALYAELTENSQQQIEHFVLKFMPGMSHKSNQRFEKITVDGRAAMKNIFDRGDWPSQNLAMPIEELMGELSFDEGKDCPAYVQHDTRLRLYSENLLPHLLKLEMPLTEEAHGMDCPDWSTLIKTGAGNKLIEAHHLGLFRLFKKEGLNFGALLKAYQDLNSCQVN